MDWNAFFGFSRYKLLAFIVLAAILLLIPLEHICVDGTEYSYCARVHGAPFDTYMVLNGSDVIPADVWNSFLLKWVLGAVGNILVAYTILSALFYSAQQK